MFTQDSTNAILLFSGLGFAVSVTTLSPFTVYNFQVIAINSAGNVSSIFTRRTTNEAPPTLTLPPIVNVISSTEISLSWFEPNELNGVLISYQLYRNNVLIVSTLQTTYSDSFLEPATSYSYILETCTNGGCTNSTAMSNTTLEALPEGVANPLLINITSRSATIRWTAPVRPNGIITEFIVTLLTNNTQLFRGLELSLEIVDLMPFTNYSISLETCNSIGCVPGDRLDVQTLQDIPEGLDRPRLRNLTSTEVAIEWSPPTAPNGEIITYILRRGNESFPNDPEVIFQGLELFFNDGELLADTLYFYTVEVVNRAGSLTSEQSYFQTVPDLPDGIARPTVTVRGSDEIFVSWSEPALPNGDISGYTLFINGNGIPLGIAFEYTARDLTPFTVYSFYFEVCNPAGCASSVTVTVVTEQAVSEGVIPPVLIPLSPTTILVSWSPPISPNGVIMRYEVRRRLQDVIFTETIQHIGDSSVLSFTNIGLTPFTAYEYRLNVINGAGSVFSDWASVMTPETIPSGVAAPTFADNDIFARNVTANWAPPTEPNGVLLNYRLEYRTILDPTTNLPGSIVVIDMFPVNITTATALGLLPVTTYEFRLVAINSAGEGASDFVTVMTGEDAPEQVQPVLVFAQTGTSLSLSWNPPLTPNGQIRVYMLYLNSELVYDGSATMTTIQNLEPFTTYSVQLVACTFVACSFGEIQSLMTAMIAPSDQPAPILTILSARSVSIQWEPPSRPNGEITMYDVLRRRAGNSDENTNTLFTTSDILDRTYIDNTVRPDTSYEYAIRVINIIGSTVSEFREIRMPEAAPEGVPSPVLNVLDSTRILIMWTPPTLPNGLIQNYRVFRTGGGVVTMSIYDGLELSFTDNLLLPFTQYSYYVQACTLAGCTVGPISMATTAEAPPTGLSRPLLVALSATSVSISWSPPSAPNGIIQSYTVVLVPGNIQITTTDLSRIITNLSPFTNYTVNLEACNSVGCTFSNANVRTLETAPQFPRPPTLRAINATTIEATWSEPSRPNGIIIRYILRREGVVVFDGNAQLFIDTNLDPDTMYSYTLQAFTSIGSSDETSIVSVQTPRDTPEEVGPPVATATDSATIRVTWSPPGQPNGIIQQYILLQNGVEVSNGLEFAYIASNLQPFTEYMFQLMVCTTTCGISESVTERTLEAPPIGQAPPTLIRHLNTTVTVNWNAPSQPNGIILNYLVERRLVPNTQFNLLASVDSLSFADEDNALTPAMSYEYRITAVNSAGQVTSSESSVTLFEAAPEGIPNILITDVTATTISVFVGMPMSPNGILTSYTLYQNGTVDTSVAANMQDTVMFTSADLRPFTVYTFYVEVCTSGGCSQSNTVTVTTLEAPPTDLNNPPSVTVLSATSVSISWEPPSNPNGLITG